jgi:hypothetical protein
MSLKWLSWILICSNDLVVTSNWHGIWKTSASRYVKTPGIQYASYPVRCRDVNGPLKPVKISTRSLQPTIEVVHSDGRSIFRPKESVVRILRPRQDCHSSVREVKWAAPMPLVRAIQGNLFDVERGKTQRRPPYRHDGAFPPSLIHMDQENPISPREPRCHGP